MNRFSFTCCSLLLVACNAGPMHTNSATPQSNAASVAPKLQPAETSVASEKHPEKGHPKAEGAVKPALRGLISMGAYKFRQEYGEPDNSLDIVRQKDGLLQGIVIVATWRNLEKSATSGLTENNEIDQGLAEVRKYNDAHPNAPLAVKLRVWGGFFAPDWVIAESGGPINVMDTNFRNVERPRTVGHVWTDSYRKEWAHLQELLAAKYDSDPLIREVAVTSCQTKTAEPFIIDTHPASLKPLRDAGLTDAAFKACLNGIVQDYAPWKTTRFETPLNPFISTDGQPERDEQFTLDWIKRCHEAEPVRCALDNHNLEADMSKNKELSAIYDGMRKSGAEVEFQSGPSKPKSLDAMIHTAVETGAESVELWQDFEGFPDMTDAELRANAKRLEENRAK